MTTTAELEAKIARLPLDLDLLHDFVKGNDTTTVVGEDGSYPSLAKFLAGLVITASANQIVFCDVATAPGDPYWRLSPKAGYSFMNPGFERQVLICRAPLAKEATPGVMLMGGVAEDPRYMVAEDLTTVVAGGQIPEGRTVALIYREDVGFYEVLRPYIPISTNAPRPAIIPVKKISRTGNEILLGPVSGGLPNNTLADTLLDWLIEDDAVPDGTVYLAVRGANEGDPYELRYGDLSVLPGSALVKGSHAFIGRPGGSGLLRLHQIWRPDAAKATGGGSSSGVTTDQLIAMRRAADTSARASRRASEIKTLLEEEWVDFTPVVSALPTPGSGMTFITRAGRYKRVGRTVDVQMEVNVSSLGSPTPAAGSLVVTLPFTALRGSIANVWERKSFGRQMVGFVEAGDANMTIYPNHAIGAWLTAPPRVYVNITYETGED